MSYSASVFPYSTVVYITDTIGGESFQASGVLISPDEVLTAAHVVYSSTEGTASNIVVTPAYEDGSAPYGSADGTEIHYYAIDDAGGWQQVLFSGFAVVISLVLGGWLAKTPRRDWKTALPFALVIGGAIGNLLDRLQHGHVVDFIQWHWRDHFWPSFNIADSGICVGVILYLWHSLRAPD